MHFFYQKMTEERKAEVSTEVPNMIFKFAQRITNDIKVDTCYSSYCTKII